MSTLPLAPRFSELSPDLFPEIVDHLPLALRASTLLSLALACRRLYDIVFPELLYNSMQLVGEKQALKTFNTLIEKAELVTKEDIETRGNPSLGHCIHHLSLCTEIDTPIRTHTSLDALKKLIEMNVLRHLESLTLYPQGSWDGTTDDGSSRIKLEFLSSLKTNCPNLKRIRVFEIWQEYEEEWIEPHIFSLENLASIHVDSLLHEYPTPTIDFSRLPTTNLHTLELRLYDNPRGQLIDATPLLQCAIPNLRTLILDHVRAPDPLALNAFWRAHPGIERLDLYNDVEGSWFDELEDGMLTNLMHLLCTFEYARVILPRVSMSLITLSVCETYNAQAPYLLRVVCPGGVLPALRSLAIHADSGNSTKPREGDRWREDENGEVLLANPKNPARKIDGNYIMSLAKAAPNLEELELMGTSNDTIESLTTSLSMFPKLSRLTLSGGINSTYKPFFPRSLNWEEYSNFMTYGTDEKDYGKYAPATFDEAARDLADGCRTLDVVTMGNILHELYISIGASRRIIRSCEGGEVKDLRKIKPWGGIIGREDEW